MRFEEQLAAARRWEIRTADWLRESRGYYVLPTYDYSGKDGDKAPRLVAPIGERNLILPDILAMQAGRWLWLEVKWKTEATFHRNKRVWNTGIDSRLWNHYQQVQDVTRATVWVVFIHEKENEIRLGSIEELRALFTHEDRIRGKLTTFFRYRDIRRIGDLSLLTDRA